MTELRTLRERAKELRCLYAVDEAVADRGRTPGSVFLRVLQAIPGGWQEPRSTGARIVYLGRSYVGPGFASAGASMEEAIRLWGVEVGHVTVTSCGDEAARARPAFLEEERELLRRIAARLGEYLEWKHTEMLGERSPGTMSHWAWRQRFAESLAGAMDPSRFAVSRAFLGGSTARGDAGPGSDIDLFLEFRGTAEQKAELTAWLEGWSRCLAEVALLQTGQPFPRGILNVHWLPGEPTARQKSELVELSLESARPTRASQEERAKPGS